MEEKRPTIGVIGAGGTMGSQISAFLAYPAGYTVVAFDQNADGLGRIDDSLERVIMSAAKAEAKRMGGSLKALKGVLDRDAYDAARNRLEDLQQTGRAQAMRQAVTAKSLVKTTTDIDDLAGCDAIIEAVFEDLKVKEKTWKEMDRVAPAAYKYTNSSSMGPGLFYGFVKDPSKVAGLHFFNPLSNNPLVEIISGRETAAQTTEYARTVAEAMKRVPIYSADAPGFIVNACLFSEFERALQLAEMGVGDIPSIDRGMVYGTSHPIGPFALMDYVGLQVVYGAAKGMQDYLKQQAQKAIAKRAMPIRLLSKVRDFAPADYFRPSPLLAYVAGDLKLNGKAPDGLGFYNWLKFPNVNAGWDGKPGMPDQEMFRKGYELEPNPLVSDFLEKNRKQLYKYHMRRMQGLLSLHVDAPLLAKPGTAVPKAEAHGCH